MKNLIIVLVIIGSNLCPISGWSLEPLTLDGNNLTITDVIAVARYGQSVTISKKALQQVKDSHSLLLAGAKKNLPIYGLNQGVGLNKDRKIFDGDAIDPEVKVISEQFNKNIIYSHSTGIGSEMPEELIRATLLIRLNTLLNGVAGIQPQAVKLYEEFINKKIHPVMPARGSVGEADIAILSHIGLAMIGEGKVYYQGEKMPAAKALAEAGLTPLAPYAKDALSILSSNAYSTALATFTLHDALNLMGQIEYIYAMSLEALNGNIAPILWEVQKLRPYCGQWIVSKRVRDILQGSYLWNESASRALQDPLSFRTATQVQGSCIDICNTLKSQILVNLNSSDDNPAVILGITPTEVTNAQERSYYVQGNGVEGAIIPSGNFQPISWVINFEALGIALSHVSSNAVQRMIHLVDPNITHLSRFLAPDNKSIAYGTIQKSFVILDVENRSLAMPVSTDISAVAGGIEDHSTNAPLVVRRIAQILENLTYISAIELMHAAQAIELRKRQDPNLQLGKGTAQEFEDFRRAVPFLDKDRVLNEDIQAAYNYLKKQIEVEALYRTYSESECSLEY
ncbi:MAG: aromatic amino acid ammonia-lyase [Chlamydiota bacterium]|nr:aromatic amino acid ammonia-lyase [Chlamydiota bacterium]